MAAADGKLWDYFSRHAVDVTPTALPGDIHVRFLPACENHDVIRDCHAVLSLQERQHAQNQLLEIGRDQFAVRRAFRKYCGSVALGFDRLNSNAGFNETDLGRPIFAPSPEINFSFSTCDRGFLAAWSKNYNLGIDIEDPARTVEPVALARRYFLPSEAHYIESVEATAQRTAFLKIWTLKEAALKSIGKGLAYGLEKFSFALEPTLKLIDAPADVGGANRFHPVLFAEFHCIAALIYYDAKDRR